MKDIARDLGVSVVTVSKVLRNHSDIGEETRERVLQRMRELNYQPNLAARALVTGKTHIIGLVAPDLVHSFFSQVAKGLSTILRSRGYGLVIASSEEDPALEKQEVDQMLARRVDGLIIASVQRSAATFRHIEEQRIPYVLIDRKLDELEANFVGIDDEAVGEQVTEHLIALGRRRIAHVGGRDVSTAVGRRVGYERALARHGIVVPAEYIACRPDYDNEADVTGYDVMKGLLQLEPRPDAVFCFNDPMALGVMKAILDAGLRIPEDIAVAGCGNLRYSDFLRVPLTSVDQDTVAIGAQAADLLLSLIDNKKPQSPKTVLLDSRLIVRQSSAGQ